MKKLTLLLLLLSIATMAQNKFELTPDGFKADGQNFMVVDIPNNTAAQLFNKVKLHLTAAYKSSKDVMSTVDNEMITINAIQRNVIRRTGMHVFDMNYNVTIRFKDDKIRFDAPTFKLTTFTTKSQTLHLVWTGLSLDGSDLGIYGKNDKLKSEMAKQDLERFFNTLITEITEACKNDKNNDW